MICHVTHQLLIVCLLDVQWISCQPYEAVLAVGVSKWLSAAGSPS